MKSVEIRALSTDEIASRLEDVREEQFKLRFQFATGQLSDYTRLRQLRRDIARLTTVLRERELAEILRGGERDSGQKSQRNRRIGKART